MNPADVPKTAIATPFGLFEYLRMGFGLRNAGATFQRHVDRAIRDVERAFAWVDDIIICSPTHAEHVLHVRQVLQALQDHGLVINGEKCVWGVPELEYLGHRIYRRRGCFPYLHMWPPSRSFPAPLLSRSCKPSLAL